MPPKTVLITGCGPGGIGSALAIEFHMRGHRVIATGLSEELLAHLRDRGMETVVLDVTLTASIEQAVSNVSKLTGGTLDILINNAGLLHIMPFADTFVEDARRLFDVNVLGVIAVARAFIPLLLAAATAARKNGDRGGGPLVANICSINSEIRPPYFSIYNATKAAVEVLSGTIRLELAPLGIRVVIVKTGAIRSEFFNNTPLMKLPEDSLYRPAREFIEGRTMLKQTPYMEPEAYAKKVVDALLKPSVKPVIWQGALTTFGWILSWFGWEGMLDGLYIRHNKLDKCAIHST
ncbi:putative short-chain dehydrogenase/reductase [Hypoxylon sp. FL0890]|nr:putative short-chain dehydrogenase/reductase [Hypoxylon sp. FL0890]